MIFQIVTASIILAALFIGGFFWAQRISFWSLVDALWSASLGVIWIFFIFENLKHSLPAEIWVLLGIGVLWSLRLTLHLGKRLHMHFPHEDNRYVELKKNWVSKQFFMFFMAQGLLAGLLATGIALPLWLSAQSHDLARLFLALSFLSLCGIFVSDRQLERFKKRTQAEGLKGRVCEEGFWAYSRHPNYFFESLTWIFWGLTGFFLLWQEISPLKYLTLFPGFMMSFLILKVTGVPYAENSSMKSRGAAYKDYQGRVSKFIPWFPSKKRSSS